MALHGGKVYIIHALAGRWNPNEVVERIVACATGDGHGCKQSLPQDPGQAGKAQRTFLTSQLMGYDVHFSPESGSKEDRARPLSAQAEAGNVYVLRGDWNSALIKEFTSFPSGKLKDQVDAASRGFHWLVANQMTELGAPPEML